MNSKLVMGLIGALIISLGAFNIYQYTSSSKQKAAYEATIAELQASQSNGEAAIEMTSAVSLLTDLKAGQLITNEDITVANVPTTSVPQNAIVDPLNVVGKVARINMGMNTILTDDVVADKRISNTTKQRQVYFDYATTDITEGDYVDIRIAYTNGADYVVIPYVQVQKAKGNFIEILMDEGQYAVYKGMNLDYLTTKEFGTRIYLDRYSEPTLQTPVKQTYVVPEFINQLIAANPNITNKIVDSGNKATQEEIKILNEQLNNSGSDLTWGDVQPEGEVTSGEKEETSNDLAGFGG